MSIFARFRFDTAGQGLFYHGQISFNNSTQHAKKTFNIVYGCGTSNQIQGAMKHMTDLVEQYHAQAEKNRSHIGLLAISHFDFDHVSHIPELLRECEVDTVMLPHIAEELRVVLLAKSVFDVSGGNDATGNEQINWNEELLELFHNPARFFAERGAAKIIGIQGDDDSEDGNRPENGSFTPFETREEQNYEPETLSLYYVGGGHQLQPEENQLKIYDRYCGDPAFRVKTNENSWLFRPFNVQENLPQTFYDEVRWMLNNNRNDWRQLLSERSRIKQLTIIYDRYIGKRRRNAHSLLLKHEPEQRGGLIPDGWHHHKNRCFQCMYCFEMCHRHWCCDNTATILLGDLELDGNAQEMLKKHQYIDQKSGVVLIPHHGADSDDLLWLDDELKNWCGCSSLVVSYGIKNTYGHPSFIFDGTLAKLKNYVAFANEEQEYRYDIIVDN